MADSTRLGTDDRRIVREMACLMMEMRRCVGQDSTFNHLRNAIAAYVLKQTGVDISKVEWHLGDERSYADDIQAVISRVVDVSEGKPIYSFIPEVAALQRESGNGEHKKWTRDDWREAVEALDTELDYWEWVEVCIQHEWGKDR
jgi:hypothetical protein